MAPPVWAGFGLVEAVLGAGLLIVPPVVAGAAGVSAPAAWLAHLVGGAVFAAVLGLMASAHTGAGSIAEVTGRALGRWAERVVLLVYLGGFVVGQAAIALAAGGLLAAGLTGGAPVPGAAGFVRLAMPGEAVSVHAAPPGWSVAAVGLLGLAAAGAVAGVRLTDPVRRWRLIVTGVVAVVVCLQPRVLATAGLLPSEPSGQFTVAVFLLFFAGVGWEASARLAPPLGDRSRIVGAMVLGAALVAVAYLTLALLLRGRPGPGEWPGEPALLGRVGALAAAVLLTAYCVTNLQAVGRFLAALGGPTGRAGVAAGGVASLASLLTALLSGWRVADVLLVPCLAAWVGYSLAMVAAVRVGSVILRVVASMLLAGLFTLLTLVVLTIF